MISKVALLAAKKYGPKIIKQYSPEVVKIVKEKGYKMGRYVWMEGGKRLIPIKDYKR